MHFAKLSNNLSLLNIMINYVRISPLFNQINLYLRYIVRLALCKIKWFQAGVSNTRAVFVLPTLISNPESYMYKFD
jgi:hypothetical protein